MPTEKAHGYQIAKMCEEFANLGIEVELWVPNVKNYIKEDCFTYYNLRKNFKVKKIKLNPCCRIFKFKEKYYFFVRNIYFSLKCFFKFKEKDTIIYTRDVWVGWLFGRRGYRTVYEAHSWPESKIGFYKFFLRKIGKVVVITNNLKKKFLKEGFNKNKILVAPDGADLKKFDIRISRKEARRKLDLPPDKRIILYTGHLYKWKGAQVLADSAKYLPEGAVIYFVGGLDSDRKNFINKNKELIRQGKVVSIKNQPHKLIPFWLKAADVLVLPNLETENISRYYTSPLKLFEYMASQRPIVASALPSIKEILGKESSVLVEPGNPFALAQGINKILDNEELGRKLAGKAYNIVQEYSWNKRAQRILNFIML